MKIFDAVKCREADEITILKQDITAPGLMERAGREVFLWLKNKFPDKETLFHIYCGRGNNGGDGLVAARLLRKDNYPVILNILKSIGTPTAGFSAALDKIDEEKIEFCASENYSYTKGKYVIIDALLGIGASRDITGEAADAVSGINNQNAVVVSVDVPSGMFTDRKSGLVVKSDVVLTFQFPKLAFYLPDNQEYVKKTEILDIGLDKEFIQNTHTDYYLTDKEDALSRYRPVAEFAHKGMQGHALVIGGSYGKIGAALLSAKAALKSGCGLVTAYIPECGYTSMQAAFPEAMVLTDGDRHITGISFGIKPDAAAIGMGMGQHPATQQAFHNFLKLQQSPLVLDADALNILSYNKEWLKLLPENSVLTPHPKELERLTGPWKDDFEKLEIMKAFADAYKIVLVVKGTRTMVVYRGSVYINATGNAALATAGSGDVLTGIITGLAAQGYSTLDAAILGVYLHGLTADLAVAETGVQSFTASTILEYLGKAYLDMESGAHGWTN